MKKSILIAGFFLYVVSTSFAQDLPKSSGKKFIEMYVDMPDETQETDLIEKRHWQIETAYLHNNYKEGKHSSVWQGLFRYGVSERLELRLLVEAGNELQRYIEETVQSTFPLAASAKILLIKDKKNLPDISLISYLQLPVYTKSSDEKAYWSPIFLLAFQNKFGKKFTLEYNVGIQQEAYGLQWSWIANASLHYKLIDQLEIFTEYFAQYHSSDNPQHNLGGGVAYQLNNYFEFFAMAGGTVDNVESNHFFNGGVAFRIP